MLFSASQAIPPVSAPSPMTATTRPVGLAAQLVAPWPGRRRRTGGRGVRVLDHVVLGLGPARVAGQAAALAQRAESAAPAGEQLVHVRLVAGVEDDPVPGRVEDPVQRDGQLHDAEVRPEMPAGADTSRSGSRGSRWPAPASCPWLRPFRSSGPEIDSSSVTLVLLVFRGPHGTAIHRVYLRRLRDARDTRVRLTGVSPKAGPLRARDAPPAFPAARRTAATPAAPLRGAW